MAAIEAGEAGQWRVHHLLATAAMNHGTGTSVIDPDMPQFVMALGADQVAVLDEAAFRVLIAAAIVMQDRLFEEIGAAAFDASLISAEPAGTASGAGQHPRGEAPLQQIEVGEAFQTNMRVEALGSGTPLEQGIAHGFADGWRPRAGDSPASRMGETKRRQAFLVPVIPGGDRRNIRESGPDALECRHQGVERRRRQIRAKEIGIEISGRRSERGDGNKRREFTARSEPVALGGGRSDQGPVAECAWDLVPVNVLMRRQLLRIETADEDS